MVSTTDPLATLPFVTAPPVIDPLTSCPNAAAAKMTVANTDASNFIFITR
jgi:hypothetical protein